jgi:hypothetical protein
MLVLTALTSLAMLGVPAEAAPAHAAAAVAPAAHTQLARFGGGFRARRPIGRGFGSRPRRGHSIFRSLLRGLIIGYLLHLLFTTPGGLIVLAFMILGGLLLVSRLRRRRAYYRY